MEEIKKEKYQTPFAEKVEFDYKEQISASGKDRFDCFSTTKNEYTRVDPCIVHYSGAALA